MISFAPGWNGVAIGTEARRGDRGVSRMGIASRLDQDTARRIIEAAADIAAKSADVNFTTYFADLVKRNDRVMIVEKGLHQEEGGLVDAGSHITLRKGFVGTDGSVSAARGPAYHLYITMVDPPPGKSAYSLQPDRLTVQVSGSSATLSLAGLPSFG